MRHAIVHGWAGYTHQRKLWDLEDSIPELEAKAERARAAYWIACCKLIVAEAQRSVQRGA